MLHATFLLCLELSVESRFTRFMMDELVEAVARAASLSPEQARLAVGAMLRFFTARLPSTLVGELHACLSEPAGPAPSGSRVDAELGR